MTTRYDAVPLEILGLSEDDIQTIKQDYPDYANIFTTQDSDHEYAIPIHLIESEFQDKGINTDLLLTLSQDENINPTNLFHYCADVFKLASKQSPTQQKQNIANAEHFITNEPKQQILQQLTQLEEQTNNASLFDILHINYRHQAAKLERKLHYDETPNKKDVWEINLVNINGIQTPENQEKQPITIVVEDFLLPNETTNTIFDSPVLVRIVGEYDDYPGLEEGNIFVATPAAFTNGTYITNLENT